LTNLGKTGREDSTRQRMGGDAISCAVVKKSEKKA